MSQKMETVIIHGRDKNTINKTLIPQINNKNLHLHNGVMCNYFNKAIFSLITYCEV